jgi:tRNA modification GTPase
MTDTIAAIATPAGIGGVGVIRVSGPRAPAMAATLLGREPVPRHAHFVRLRDAQGASIDQALLLFFPAPHSFTGESVLELHTHGSPFVLQLALQRLVELGARSARPGEFSERAFLSGKIDLAQAEAIADLIAAGSEVAARAALRSLEGEFSRRVQALFERLVEARLHVEAAIDFPEEEIDFLGDARILARIEGVLQDLDELLVETRRGQRLLDGLHVVILGAPNAGKSSLLNALAGHERAIVTDQPGTTRDLLRESIRIDGLELTLVDTAGLREGGDVVEREGMRRARDELLRADLVLALVAPGDDAGPLRETLAAVPRVLWVRSKSDLAADGGTGTSESVRPSDTSDTSSISISTVTGAGLAELTQQLTQAAGGDGSDGAFSARARHVAALQDVSGHVTLARLRLTEGNGELVAEELHLAQNALAGVTGRFHNDELLGRIFSSFCIGK